MLQILILAHVAHSLRLYLDNVQVLPAIDKQHHLVEDGASSKAGSGQQRAESRAVSKESQAAIRSLAGQLSGVTGGNCAHYDTSFGLCLDVLGQKKDKCY